LHAPQSDHTEEVLYVVLPANYEPTKMMEPSEKSLNSPTSAIWFSKVERDVIARGIFTSVKDLARKLRRYINAYPANAKPIQWRYSDPTRRIRSNVVSATCH
jgi:hypothetical protein